MKDYAAFFLLDIPISPSRPEPKSQTAAGIGMGLVESNVTSSNAIPAVSGADDESSNLCIPSALKASNWPLLSGTLAEPSRVPVTS